MLLLLAHDIRWCNTARLQYWNRFRSQNRHRNSKNWVIFQYGCSYITHLKCFLTIILRQRYPTSMVLELTGICAYSCLLLLCIDLPITEICIPQNWLNSDTVSSHMEHLSGNILIICNGYSTYDRYIDSSYKEQLAYLFTQVFLYLRHRCKNDKNGKEHCLPTGWPPCSGVSWTNLA